MKMDLATVLRTLELAGTTLPAFQRLFDQVVQLFGEQDQAVLREALADAQADNDEGHKRLQEKLAAAAQR